MLVPKLRFKREDGTKYPEWKERELKDVAKILMGQSPSGSSVNANKNGIPLVQGKADILGYGVISDRYTSAPTKVSEPNDIIMTVRAPVGYVAKLGFTACIGRGVCAIRANENEDFVYYVLQNKESEWKYIEQGSTFTAVNSDDVSSLIVSIPCFEEQQKIAGFLSTVDEVITQSEAEVQNLEQQKKSAMQKIFSQELRFKREGGTDYPEWEQASLEDVCDIVGGGTPSTKNIDYWNGNIQWFTPSEIGKTKYVSKSVRTISQVGLEKSSARKLPVGTILLTSRATLGEMAIATIECTTNQGFQSLIPRRINGEYLYYLQPTIKNYCNKKACGSTFNEISKGELGKCKIPMPHFEEQQKIADFLSVLDEAISYAKQELDKWKELKKGLLQQMFV